MFFLPKGSKKPAPGSDGFHSASTDPSTIRAMAEANPDHTNLAAVPGPHYVVIDADEYKPAPGIARWRGIEAEIDPTLTSTTPSGGRHLWFECPSDLKVTAYTGTKGYAGIDLRGEGGYVLVAPSMYLPTPEEVEKGRSPGLYTWMTPGGAFLPVAIQTMPDTVRGFIDGMLSKDEASEDSPDTTNPGTDAPVVWQPPRYMDAGQLRHFADCVDRDLSRVLADMPRRIAEADSRHEAILAAANRLGAYRWGLEEDHAAEIRDRLAALAPGSDGIHRTILDGWNNAKAGPVTWPDKVNDPMVVKFPAHPPYVRAPEGTYHRADPAMAAKECRRWYPYIWQPPQKGQKGIAYFEKHFGERGDELEYTYNPSEAGYRRAGREGILTVCRVHARPMTPEFDPACDEWLHLLAGPRYTLLEQWIAGLGRLDHPAACPIIWGASGAGKQMVAVAAALQFGSMPFDFAKASSRFNIQQVRQPVTWQDESVTNYTDTNLARRMIGNSIHAVEGKNQPTATLQGAIRLLATAQNVDPFKFDTNLKDDDRVSTLLDRKAIWHRMLVIPVNDDAPQWLADKGGRAFTHDWVGTTKDPGRLVRHFRHLITTVEVLNLGAGRLIAEDPDYEVWADRAAANTGREKRLLGWILAALETWNLRGTAGSQTPGKILGDALVWTSKGVWVHAPTLVKLWAPFTGTDRNPWYLDTVQEVLDNLVGHESGVGRRRFPRTHPLGQLRGHFVPVSTLRASDRHTAAEVEEMLSAILKSASQGAQGAQEE